MRKTSVFSNSENRVDTTTRRRVEVKFWILCLASRWDDKWKTQTLCWAATFLNKYQHLLLLRVNSAVIICKRSVSIACVPPLWDFLCDENNWIEITNHIVKTQRSWLTVSRKGIDPGNYLNFYFLNFRSRHVDCGWFHGQLPFFFHGIGCRKNIITTIHKRRARWPKLCVVVRKKKKNSNLSTNIWWTDPGTARWSLFFLAIPPR